MTEEAENSPALLLGQRARNSCFWLLVATLAWAPFPLGSNREWSWGLLMLLGAGCALLWALWGLADPAEQGRRLKPLWLPLCLAMVVLCWALIQALPLVPSGWVHPAWTDAATLLGSPLRGTVSLNPWATLNEAAKLFTYAAIGVMVFTLCRNAEKAKLLVNAIIVIGVFYAVYAFVLRVTHTTQFHLFYALPYDVSLSGPFVGHNNFATYEGLIALAALSQLVATVYRQATAFRGRRRVVFKSVSFVAGRGTPLVIAVILAVSALVGTGSRGGFLASIAGLIFLAASTSWVMKHKISRTALFLCGLVLVGLLLPLMILSGTLLTEKMQQLIQVGSPDPVRLALWSAAVRMILSAPILGLGLGTYPASYPLYATAVYPYVMDKAHSDFLEFAAGLGLPAAFCWWSAWAILFAQLLYGASARRRNRSYALLAAAATVLVAVHSLVDFSLQIPAVSATYAALMGVGLAQSLPSRRGHRSQRHAPAVADNRP